MESQSHNNPWADKLQEVSIPEAGEAWQAMETLLNKELPGSGRITRWRWLGFSFSAVVLTVAVYFIWFARHEPARGLAAAAFGGRPAVAPSPVKPDGSSGAFGTSSQGSRGSQDSRGSRGFRTRGEARAHRQLRIYREAGARFPLAPPPPPLPKV